MKQELFNSLNKKGVAAKDITTPACYKNKP